MIRKHYNLQVTFNFGPEYIEYEPDEIPEGEDPLDYCLNQEYVQDCLQYALDDGYFDYDITPLPALDEN